MITLRSETEYFAKRRLIRSAVEHFIKNPNDWAVEIQTKWKDEEKPEDEFIDIVLVNRDTIIKFIGFDFRNPEHQSKLYDPVRWHKNVIVELYDQLKADVS